MLPPIAQIATSGVSVVSRDRIYTTRMKLPVTLYLFLMYAVSKLHLTKAINASPHHFSEVQADGTKTGKLYIRGGTSYYWVEDSDGYTVCFQESSKYGQKGKGKWFYCKEDADGDLQIQTNLQVGKSNPRVAGLRRGERVSFKKQKEKCGDFCSINRGIPPSHFGGARSSIGTLKNLVVLMIFIDHQDRDNRPSEADVEVLMNSDTPHATLCPTGSLKQYFLDVSNNRLSIESTVHAWVYLPNSEAYYANGKRGISSRTHEAVVDALDIIDAAGFKFDDFDEDRDGYIDAITFLHSGYSAEWGGTDAYGATTNNRIWSHKWWLWSVNNRKGWTSRDGVTIYDYHISPAIWHRGGNMIGRVGT